MTKLTQVILTLMDYPSQDGSNKFWRWPIWKEKSMFGLPNLQVLGLGVLLVAAAAGYHVIVTKTMEATIANQKVAIEQLNSAVTTLETANKTIADSLSDLQIKQEQLALVARELSKSDLATAEAFNDIRESVDGHKSLEKLSKELESKPDETIEAINNQIACVLRNLGTPANCLNPVAVQSVGPVPKR